MWQDLERRIRNIASNRWNCNATTETIAGVKCDCVLKPQPDEWIIVEITEESSLEKVRTDIAKLVTVKQSLFMNNVFARCYFVMKNTPTDSMRAAGDAQKIFVRSAEEFQNEYFQYSNYVYTRKKKQFGSLINIETGEPESNIYIDVSYSNLKTGKDLSIDEIINLLKSGKKVILKGDFGLGKSRCVKQIFDILTQDVVRSPYTIAINLREHWGAKRALEILNRHFSELGLDAQNFIKTYEQPNTIYLLDGFDEIGTQSWSSDPRKMQHLREISVCALKDLVGQVQGGVLITGREYYFNSDAEMLSSLGLSSSQTILLECHQEFTDTQLLKFIAQNIPATDAEKALSSLPAWFPKRPIVIQLLLKYASDIFTIDLHIISEYIKKDAKRIDLFISIARNASSSENKILASDIVSALCLLDTEYIDFQDLFITDAHFSYLSFEGKEINRLSISNSCIERINLTNSKFTDQVQIRDCIISTIYGISSIESVPSQIIDCDIDNYEALATTTLIKRANLSLSQKLLVDMLQKIFFQPGAGRKEAALLRGMGVSANKPLGERILRKLMDENFVTRHKGDEGYIYKAQRSQTGRVKKIMTDLTLSNDPLWKYISSLSK